jgi:hypothetical protein
VTLLLLAAPACVCGFEPVAEVHDHPPPAPSAVDAAVAVDAGPCVDDSREENDSVRDAGWTVSAISPNPVTLSNLVACEGDPDFIAAYSDCCLTNGVTVTWNPERGPLSVALLGQTGDPVAPDIVERDAGFVRLWRSKSGGVFFVEIHGSNVPYQADVLAPVFGP